MFGNGSRRRDGDWWSLVAADVQEREVASQSRCLHQAEAAMREAIAVVLDVAQLLRVTPSRASQIEKQDHPANSA